MKTLGYADKNVSAGTTYYYKATATDQAGNEGPRSEAVSGMLLADTEPPIINSIGPRHNSSVGINPTISVLAQDRAGLASITAQYQQGEDWVTIGTVNCSGDSYIAEFIWDNENLPSGNCNLRFFATDKNGNVSQYYDAVYNIKNQPPEAPYLTAEPDDWRIWLFWEPIVNEDLAGYELYRRDSEQEDKLIKIFGLEFSTYIHEDGNINPYEIYSYYVKAYDKYNNVSVSNIVTVSSLANDPYPPIAKAGESFNIPIGVEAAFDASASTDNDMIASYLWDFGDGQTGTESVTTHVYETAGTYDATLTVTDPAGNANSDTIKVTAMSPLSSGILKIKVLDRDTGLPLENASIYLELAGVPAIAKTNRNGEFNLAAAPGEYKLAAYKNNSFLMRKYPLSRKTPSRRQRCVYKKAN